MEIVEFVSALLIMFDIQASYPVVYESLNSPLRPLLIFKFLEPEPYLLGSHLDGVTFLFLLSTECNGTGRPLVGP